jgi:2-polyprenyl-3-methyl-5-hydroxy-6-metoxy-1,4-benzoquinol methylase
MSKYSEVFKKSESLKKNSTHRKVLDLIGNNKRVIDFGCAAGYLDKILIQEYGCEVWGVELNKIDAKEARKVCKKVIVADIENVNKWSRKISGEKFDVAVFADVLEHLRNPLEVLKGVKKILAPDGYVVTSIPNVAHSSVRLELLLGQWEYEPIGLLDNTHIRFFTHTEIIKLFHDAGFYIKEVDYKIERPPEKLIEGYLRKQGFSLTKDLRKILYAPDALVFQYIVSASSKKPIGYKKPDVKILPKVVNEWGREKLELRSLKAKNKQLNKDLNRIRDSKTYRLWQIFAKTRNKILGLFG